MQSNTGDKGGSRVNVFNQYIQTNKASFAHRSSSQTADKETFGTIVSAVTSYSGYGSVKVDHCQPLHQFNHCGRLSSTLSDGV